MVLKIRQPRKVQHYETLSLKSKQHILKSINQQRNSEAKHNVPPLRPQFSLISHPPPLSLMLSHNALMRCELMRWFEMGLPVIPLSTHLSNTGMAASVRPAATAHKSKWDCDCGWAKKKGNKKIIKWCNQINIVSVTGTPLMWRFQCLHLTCQSQFNL